LAPFSPLHHLTYRPSTDPLRAFSPKDSSSRRLTPHHTPP
jgi:hypothetical protein